MADFLGTGVDLPSIEIGGFFTSTWVYVLIVVIFGMFLIGVISLFLYFSTFNRKVIFFENISGLGYQPAVKTRARLIKVGNGGEELLKTLAGGRYLTAYGKKMGKRTYWFAKAQDGYYYNVVLGDVDTKLNMLDIEPVDRDVRMLHVAIDRLSHQTYGKTSFLEKYGIHMMLFIFLIVLILGMWFIIGKVGESTQSLSATAETNREVAELLRDILRGTVNIRETGSSNPASGIIEADLGG